MAHLRSREERKSNFDLMSISISWTFERLRSSLRFFVFVVMFRAIVFIFGTIGVSVTEARIGHRELELLRKPYPLGDERAELQGGWAVEPVSLTLHFTRLTPTASWFLP